MSGNNPQDSWGFATYWRDSATGLDYANQRYSSSQFGRFMTPDPNSGSGQAGNPQSWNRYAYVLGDPVNGIDPTGEGTCSASSFSSYAHGGDPYAAYIDSSSSSGADNTSGSCVGASFTDNSGSSVSCDTPGAVQTGVVSLGTDSSTTVTDSGPFPAPSTVDVPPLTIPPTDPTSISDIFLLPTIPRGAYSQYLECVGGHILIDGSEGAPEFITIGLIGPAGWILDALAMLGNAYSTSATCSRETYGQPPVWRRRPVRGPRTLHGFDQPQ
jgi:RHS repeat-associated protein